MSDIDFGAHREYNIVASWKNRVTTAEALAERFMRQIDTLTAVDPVFALWISGAGRPTKFETVRDRYVDVVKAHISKDDFGEPDPIFGYYLGAMTRGHPSPFRYGLTVHEGCHMPGIGNDAILETCAGIVPDPAAITYRIFKSVLLSFVGIWEPLKCVAYPSALQPLYKNPNNLFHEAWMQYLSPSLAAQITPPDTVILDHLPNGALLMSATTETFRVDNPAHLAAARDIEAATAPLNELS